jgi:hypothetical protein
MLCVCICASQSPLLFCPSTVRPAPLALFEVRGVCAILDPNALWRRHRNGGDASNGLAPVRNGHSCMRMLLQQQRSSERPCGRPPSSCFEQWTCSSRAFLSATVSSTLQRRSTKQLFRVDEFAPARVSPTAGVKKESAVHESLRSDTAIRQTPRSASRRGPCGAPCH